MIQIPRLVLKTFWQLCRRAGIKKRAGGAEPVVNLASGTDGLRLSVATDRLAIQYHQIEPAQSAQFRVPLDAIEVCSGRDQSPVTLSPIDGDVLVSWEDSGVPRQSRLAQPDASSQLAPEVPTELSSNGPELWEALREAAATVDPHSTRYALSCVHLRGSKGRLEATDGRQVFAQDGFCFGFEQDLLVEATKLLGCIELAGQPVAVGHRDDWLALVLGPWTLQFAVQKEGRFPDISSYLRSPGVATSRLDLSASDSQWLASRLPKLPCDDQQHQPISLDLNGQVLVRCRENANAKPTELRLSSSQLTGNPLAVSTNRVYLERALRLGFRQVHFYGENIPAYCTDGRRHYLWAMLTPEDVIPRTKDMIYVSSPEALSHSRRRRASIAPTRRPAMTSDVQSVTMPGSACSTRSAAKAPATALEQAVTLRDDLRGQAKRAGDLVRAIKADRRQARLVRSTLASLKALQKVAG